jgi:hypothetical protein
MDTRTYSTVIVLLVKLDYIPTVSIVRRVVDVAITLIGLFQWTSSTRFSTLCFASRNIHIHVDPQTHSELLLSKEWLVKIDNEKSVPYLMVRISLMAKLWHVRRVGTSPSRSYTHPLLINHPSS